MLASSCATKAQQPSVGSSSGVPAISPSSNGASSPGQTQAAGLRVTSWTGLPVALQRSVAVNDAGTLYLAGGLDTSDQSTSDVYAIDAATGKSNRIGSVPQAFHDAAGALIGGKLQWRGAQGQVGAYAPQRGEW
jgi:hypothetical protein